MAVVIAAVLASLPAGASAEVVTPKAVKPEVVKPQAVTPSPTPAPSSAPAPNRGSGSAPVRPSSPSAEPVGDTPDPSPVPRPGPRPVPTGEKPPFPTPPDYRREGLPTCTSNNTDVERRCRCDPAWCRYFMEQQAWDRWEEEHRGDQSGEINAESQAATANDQVAAARAAAAAKSAAEKPLGVEDFIQAVITVKEMIERAGRPLTPEEKCQCSIGPRVPSLSLEYNSSPMGPPEPGIGTAAREVADTLGEAVGGLSKLLEEIQLAAN